MRLDVCYNLCSKLRSKLIFWRNYGNFSFANPFSDFDRIFPSVIFLKVGPDKIYAISYRIMRSPMHLARGPPVRRLCQASDGSSGMVDHIPNNMRYRLDLGPIELSEARRYWAVTESFFCRVFICPNSCGSGNNWKWSNLLLFVRSANTSTS